jgi:hypothetical protein
MKKRSEDKGRLPPFVAVDLEVMRSPAWRAMTKGARLLYVSLRRHWSRKQRNNGRLFLSQRVAKKELGSGRDSISRWFRELQHYGFIVMTNPGGLGVDGKGKAPHWQLTELEAPGGRGGNTLMLPTKDFLNWTGVKFKDDRGAVKRAAVRLAKKTESRPANAGQGGPQMQAGPGPQMRSLHGTSGPQMQAIQRTPPGPQMQAISSSTISTAASLPWQTPSIVEVTDPTELVALLAELPDREQLKTWPVFRRAARAAPRASAQPPVCTTSASNGQKPAAEKKSAREAAKIRDSQERERLMRAYEERKRAAAW